MNNRKEIFLYSAAAVLVLLGAVFARVALNHAPQKPGPASTRVAASPRPSPTVSVASANPKPTPVEAPAPKSANANPPRSRRTGKLVLDPNARTALKSVGSNPEAEQYWLGAINNPLLPPEERKDLIEDLNEDGLSDPKHPGVADLPLIATRIKLIESLMPEAMDQTNAAALREAHKDLVNMYAKLSAPEAP